MTERDKFRAFIEKHPHSHLPFFHRPHCTRRHFFQLFGGAVTASVLGGRSMGGEVASAADVTPRGTAKNVIFILLAGAPSHIDTFDFHFVDGVTPDTLAPETIDGIVWPVGLLPKLAGNLPDMAIVRSVRAWALVHSLAQTWAQIGRNPAAALGDIAPNIGSVVAIEKEAERRPTDVFPTFLALNTNQVAGSGYLSSSYAPFRFTPAAGQPSRGLPNVTAPAAFGARWELLQSLDRELRLASPLGSDVEDFGHFYEQARGMIDNAQPGGAVDQAFKFTSEDAERYGSNNFGAACLVAKQVLEADRGTRYIEIVLGGWDHHQNIYQANFLPRLSTILDNGVSAMLNDLKSSGLLDQTLVVMMGEFGRTVGPLSGAAGRDHYLQQFAMFAGAGVRGGRAIGSTDDTGASTADSGWSRDRDIRVEDVEATMYSALGINWTSVRYDDPTGRGFELVPFSSQDLYGPIDELWS